MRPRGQTPWMRRARASPRPRSRSFNEATGADPVDAVGAGLRHPQALRFNEATGADPVDAYEGYGGYASPCTGFNEATGADPVDARSQSRWRNGVAALQ